MADNEPPTTRAAIAKSYIKHELAEGKDPVTVLYYALYSGFPEETLRPLLGRISDDKLHSHEHGRALLNQAVSKRYRAIPLALVARGAPLEEFRDGRTTLMWAAYWGHTELVQDLTRAGVQLDTRDKFGWSALVYGEAYGHDEVAAILLEAGAEADGRNFANVCTLAGNVQREDIATVRQLLRDGAALNQLCNRQSPLHYAARNGLPEIAQVLLDHGADSLLQDSRGLTPLDYALDRWSRLKASSLAPVSQFERASQSAVDRHREVVLILLADQRRSGKDVEGADPDQSNAH